MELTHECKLECQAAPDNRRDLSFELHLFLTGYYLIASVILRCHL